GRRDRLCHRVRGRPRHLLLGGYVGLRRHAADRRDVPAADGVPADRGPLHHGARAGRESVRAAWREADRADALRDVSCADGNTREAAGARRAARREGSRAEARRNRELTPGWCNVTTTSIMRKQLFIDNEWRDSSGGAMLEVVNPATEEVIAEVASAERS